MPPNRQRNEYEGSGGEYGYEDTKGTMSTADRSRYSTLGLVAGLFLLSTAAAAYEIAPASVLPVVRGALDIGPTAAGWLVSVMYATAVLASVPVGFLLDRVSVRRR
jgi:predicted MFS family arabinose efflux permease